MFGVRAILPSQLGPRRADGGGRALLVELLREALCDAGVMPGIAPTHPRRRALALAWLTGTFDDGVALPIGFVCDALGLDARLLAAAGRARATIAHPRRVRAHSEVLARVVDRPEGLLSQELVARGLPPASVSESAPISGGLRVSLYSPRPSAA